MTDIAVNRPAEHGLPPRAARRAQAVLPGLLLTASVAGVGFGVRELPGIAIFSPMILAIVIGMAFHNLLGTPARAKPGVQFSLKVVLRIAIVMLGLQLTTMQLVTVGARGLAIVVATLGATFFFTKWLGRLLGVDRKLAELIAAGTSICGASAVIATNTVTDGRDEDVAYAVACVTVFGSMSMFLYPALFGVLHLAPKTFGLWAGASIHEIAQVVAASFQVDRQAGEFGTIAKLSRVMMLAPLVLSLGAVAARKTAHHPRGAARKKPPMPWFVLGFVALVIVNSLFPIPPALKSLIVTATTFLLSVALAAMGLETDFRKLRAEGLRPLLLGAAAWVFISCFSLALVELIA